MANLQNNMHTGVGGTSSKGSAVNRPQVLIADPAGITAMSLKYFVESLGFDAEICCNTCKAMDIARIKRPEILIIDPFTLGNTPACEAARSIRSLYSTRIIFLIPMNDKGLINRLNAICPACYVTKPFNEYDFIAALKEQMNRPPMPSA